MASEATLRVSLTIKKGNLTYVSQPAGYNADVSGTFGPTPGAINVTTTGVDVSLTALTHPGLCRVMNLDDTNYVQLGTKDPDNNRFYPLIRLLPGESYVFRLDPDVGKEYVGAGTGTAGTNNPVHLKAANAACVVLFEAFES
jgi:hypothetical protein